MDLINKFTKDYMLDLPVVFRPSIVRLSELLGHAILLTSFNHIKVVDGGIVQNLLLLIFSQVLGMMQKYILTASWVLQLFFIRSSLRLSMD